MSQFTILAEVNSDSNLNKAYRVSMHRDGYFACSCRGWTRHFPRKDCRHIQYFKMGSNAGVKRTIDGDIALGALQLSHAA